MLATDKPMELIADKFGYHYYKGMIKGKILYNVIPENEYPNYNPPLAGYASSAYVCDLKNVPNLFN